MTQSWHIAHDPVLVK